MKTNKKQVLLNCLKISGLLCVLTLFLAYFFFIQIPKKKAELILYQFEQAIRSNDKEIVEHIVSNKTTYMKLLERDGWDREFKKFDEGIKVQRCLYVPKYFSNWDMDTIAVEGKMRAKIDGKFRRHFPISLVKENGNWKIEYFYFPDFIDY